jgi:hypothetical protein
VVFYNTMAQDLRRFSGRHLRVAALIWACFAGLFLGDNALAITRAEMYQAAAPAADRSEAGQTAAIQSAMKTVLIRVTGRRNADEDPVFGPLISIARRYVQSYRSAPDNQLLVSFDGAAIERWLTQNGQPLWGRERPTTLVLLAVQSGAQGTVVTTEDNSELKSAIDGAAVLRGLPLVWPSAAEVQKYHIDYATLNSGASSTFSDIARRMGSDAVLVGRASGATANANIRWTHLFQDRSSEYSGTLEGINRAADLYAGMFAASGTLAPVEIEVTGVADLKDYAGVQSYLESLTSVSHVSVESLSGDTVRFRLSTRGSVDSLQRALSLNGRLQSIAAGENGIQRFQLHR